LVTGEARVENPFANPNISYNIQADAFKLDNDSIGTITSVGNYSASSGLVHFKAVSENTDNNFNIEGSFNSKDSSENQTNILMKYDTSDY